MAAKGSIAKDKLAKKIASALGADWIGEHDKKYYCWSEENGERVQISIAMTCPKTPVQFDSVPVSDSEDSDFPETTPTNIPAQMCEDEKATLERLMKELGI